MSKHEDRMRRRWEQRRDSPRPPRPRLPRGEWMDDLVIHRFHSSRHWTAPPTDRIIVRHRRTGKLILRVTEDPVWETSTLQNVNGTVGWTARNFVGFQFVCYYGHGNDAPVVAEWNEGEYEYQFEFDEIRREQTVRMLIALVRCSECMAWIGEDECFDCAGQAARELYEALTDTF